MSGKQPIPEGLAQMPPGPELSAVLAGLDLSRLSSFDCVEVLKARFRQVNHERAGLLAAMREVGRCGDGPIHGVSRREEVDEFAADEIRAALALTRRSAQGQLQLADELLGRLPAVFAAMAAGLVDQPRARILVDWTLELSEPQARALCDELLPLVPELTTGQLIERIKRAAIAIDPTWAQRRYEQAVARRRVVGSRNPDGSSNLSGLDLPADRAAAAATRIDALAKAAKRAGHPDTLDRVRAELFLGLTDGAYAGLADNQILELLLDEHTAERPDDPDQGPDIPPPDDDQPQPEPQPDPRPEPPGPQAGRRGGIELRIGLATLIGRDEHPGELAGHGPIHAELARAVAAGLSRAQWRFAVTDPAGQLRHTGITRKRPRHATPGIARTGDAVELHIDATTLEALAAEDPEQLAGWAPVIGDLARQHAAAEQHRADGTDPYAGDAQRRFPGDPLRRHVQIRDRYCIGPGCRAPATTGDLDHTHDHARGGSTTRGNLGGTCKHEHRLKHEGGWNLQQPETGHFRWTTRLGHTYDVPARPITPPLPEPHPRDHAPPPVWVPPDEPGWQHSTVFDPPAADRRATEPEPRPPPGEPDDEDEPPF